MNAACEGHQQPPCVLLVHQRPRCACVGDSMQCKHTTATCHGYCVQVRGGPPERAPLEASRYVPDTGLDGARRKLHSAMVLPVMHVSTFPRALSNRRCMTRQKQLCTFGHLQAESHGRWYECRSICMLEQVTGINGCRPPIEKQESCLGWWCPALILPSQAYIAQHRRVACVCHYAEMCRHDASRAHLPGTM